jgi:hypothetical protein
MRIRVVDLTELFGPAVHLRAPEFLEPLTWSQLADVRELWRQLAALAEGDTVLSDDAETVFGGAVVLLLPRQSRAALAEAIIVDGRQRLVAWQLLIDASRRSMAEHGAAMVARTLEGMLENTVSAALTPDEHRVVLPSRADRREFADCLTLDRRLLAAGTGPGTGITGIHAWLLDAIGDWLDRGEPLDRAQRLARVLMHRLRVVAIEGRAEENPLRVARQLAAARVPITAIDLVGQTLLDSLALPDESAERAYDAFLAPFSDPWWDAPVDGSAGSEIRSEQILRAWLMARTMRVVAQADLAPAFQRYLRVNTTHTLDLVSRLHDEGRRVRALFESALDSSSRDDPRARFLYRMSVLGSAEAIAIALWLESDEQAGVPVEQRAAVLTVVESWVVRRALTGLDFSGTGVDAQALFTWLSRHPARHLGDDLPAAIAQQRRDEHYWPSDDDLRLALPSRPLAVEMSESSARVIVEALAEEELGHAAVTRGISRVTLRHPAPTGAPELTPMLRHVLGNLALGEVWPVRPTDAQTANDEAIEQCIRIWPGPPSAVESPSRPVIDIGSDDPPPWASWPGQG